MKLKPYSIFNKSRYLSSRVIFGDVEISINNSLKSNLVPQGYLSQFKDLTNPEIVSQFRWIAQKYNLNQDIFFLSAPNPLAKQLFFAFAELCNWEVKQKYIFLMY